MMKLERIVPGCRLTGVVGEGAEEILMGLLDADRFEGRFRGTRRT